MAGGCAWSRRVAARTRTMRGLVRDTQRALHDVCDILNYDPEILGTVQDIGTQCNRPTALVVLGSTPAARARLLHCLLGRRLLPEPTPRGCRWLKIQYGSSTQVHLTLGNSEFELVEELECNKRPWETLPLEDLLRHQQNDLSTILEIELNNSFLKDGLKIIVPPDIQPNPGATSYQTLKETNTDLFTKRETILRHYNAIYLYALDRIGKSVFSENIGDVMVTSRSDEDFWASFNLYSVSRVSDVSEVSDVNVSAKQEVPVKVVKQSSGEPSVFDGENCLDLHQIKEINPHVQLLFVLFSDSVDMSAIREQEGVNEATESAEDMYRADDLPESDQGLLEPVMRSEQESPIESKRSAANRRLREEQIGFMNEVLDQWEMCSPPPKHHAKSRWLIANDTDIMRTVDHKVVSQYAGAGAHSAGETCERGGTVSSRPALLSAVVKFATECAQSALLECSTQLSEVHVKLLQQFILASFDLARELQVVPKKIQYVATQEQQLYETINNKFSEGDKKQELVGIMQEVLHEMQTEVDNMDWSVDDLPCHRDTRFLTSNSMFYSTRSSPPPSTSPPPPPLSSSSPGRPEPTSDGEEALSYDSYNFDDYDIINEREESLSVSYVKSNSDDASVVISQANNIRVENEETFGLSNALCWTNATVCTNAGNVSVKEASLDVQQTVCTNAGNVSVKVASLDVQQTVLSKLSRKISLKLVNFLDCLRETYFGTLQRCLESLEMSCRQELGGRPASEAMRQLLSVARQVQLQPTGSFSLLRSLLDSLRRFLHRLRLYGSESDMACCALSPAWRRRVALHALHSLTPHRLARIISAQILEKLTLAHEKYQSALVTLEAALEGRLHHTEAIKLAIRKKYAPSFARLCLESTSMCDLLMYGTPELGREIGRGQYGVVYSVRGSWAGHSPAAVKSVLPADERHYHELAMEFFYTRSIPWHPRIVRLLGSVVQRGAGAGAGAGPGVLLVSERRARDLHAAVRARLGAAASLRVAADIVEGIRYLHSLGLVHRDIKMKNVLLDSNDRAALSDLGFCAAEALISGSVVGTPVHMAPELLNGEYDASVDVYAFGILFWYLCAGNVKLPTAFEMFQNKEQLWSKVKRGLRPERLPHFTDECWEIMESCWASEPSQRALLGDVQPKLERMLEKALLEDQGPTETHREYKEYDSDDSLDMTGIDRDLV